MLRCQHDPRPQGDLVQDGCTFETLLAALPDAWIVLDIKTDFEAVGQRIVDRMTGTADAGHIVFQLHDPGTSRCSIAGRRRRRSGTDPDGVPGASPHRSCGRGGREDRDPGVHAPAGPVARADAAAHRRGRAGASRSQCASWADAMRRADGVYMLSTAVRRPILRSCTRMTLARPALSGCRRPPRYPSHVAMGASAAVHRHRRGAAIRPPG